MSYFGFENLNHLLLIIKFSFLFSNYSLYSFLLFVRYYWSSIKILQRKRITLWAGLFFAVLGYIYLWTDYILKGLTFNHTKQDYYEEYWNLGYMHTMLTLFGICAIVYTAKEKLSQFSFVNYLRLKYILYGPIFSLSLLIFFVLILPLFGILIFEKEIFLFMLPIIFFTWYGNNKYHFIDMKLSLWKISVFVLSIFWAVSVLYFIKNSVLHLWEWFKEYWGISNSFGIIDLIMWIVVFAPTHNYLWKVFLWDTQVAKFHYKITKLKKEIPFITNLSDLNDFLKVKFHNFLKVNHIEINLNKEQKSEIIQFFENWSNNNNMLINDFVFLEENKNKFNIDLVSQQLNPKTLLIFPLTNNKWDIIWTLSLGKKVLNQFYSSEEIEIIEDFKTFIEGHLKYIEIYEKIHNLSVNLDKQVTEKTIEYNNLINKQKEFIALISHEVKSPIASAIFQADCLHDDVKHNRCTTEWLQEELDILNKLLLKAGNLINKLFSIQQFDIETIQLFKEKVDIGELLESEANLFQKMHTDKSIYVEIQNDLHFIEIDKIQFKQVIDNLITNAVKFSDKNNGKVLITANKGPKYYTIEIEDNWKWFTDLNIAKIFDKYSTGSSNSIWLWIGLYLCKKIVELHWGKIQANFWKKLWWAKISVKLPVI